MTSYVYFVSDSAGAIKIGYSAGIERRMVALGTGTARGVELLGMIEGARSQEKAIHQKLAPHRMSGEWFVDCAEVRSLMVAILQNGLAASGFPHDEAVKDDLPTLAEAKALADVIVRCTGISVVDGPGEICGVSRQLLWRLRYRPGKDIYADELSALRSAALQATEIAMNRAADDRRWVVDICLNIEAARLRDDHLNRLLRDLEAKVRND